MNAKQKRENRAIEAIIAGVLRGFDKKDWQRVFRRMDEIERQRKLKDRQHQEESSRNIYG